MRGTMKNGFRGSPVLNDRHGAGSRRPGWAALYALLVVAAVWLALGCAGSKYTYIDADKNPVTVESKWYGSGCVAYGVDAKGNPRLIHSVDAETNWITGRIVPPLVNLAGAILTGRIGGVIDTPGPSGIGGCRFLFLDQGEDVDDLEPE